MNAKDGFPLKCEITTDGSLNITIGINTLKIAAENCPSFWNGEKDCSLVHITDPIIFAKEVVKTINEEDEAGNTLLTDMLDKAFVKAIEFGCDGIEDF